MLLGVNLNVDCFVKNYQTIIENDYFFIFAFGSCGSWVCCFLGYYFDLSLETKV